jgi:hypothetical protein
MKKSKEILYTQAKWAVDQITRETGLVEDICKHGIGHPNDAYMLKHPKANSVHGCDGCCSPKPTYSGEVLPDLKVAVEKLNKQMEKYDSNTPSYDATFNFIQNGDTCQADCLQELKIDVISNGVGHFLRLTTKKTGWSIDSPEDLIKILKFVAQVQSDNSQISGVTNVDTLD